MQTKKRSIIESCCNTLSGLVLAYFIWDLLVIPVYINKMHLDMNQLSVLAVFGVNIIFTVVSVVRGYVWRRFFNMIDSVDW